MVIHGDSNNLPLIEESVDMVVTDPPYGYSFMGKDWDKAVPPVSLWRECMRVMKPGAFAFVMSSPRQDVLSRMIVNLQDAGFETGFTSLYWAYATGFPKSTNIAKIIYKRLGHEREITQTIPTGGYANMNRINQEQGFRPTDYYETTGNLVRSNVPISAEAAALDGSYAGFQPKPAVEVVLIVMKPLSEKSYVEQAMKNGKGIAWLDDCRIPLRNGEDLSVEADGDRKLDTNGQGWGFKAVSRDNRGRFPANVLVSDDVLNDGVTRKSTDGKKPGPGDCGSFSRYFDLDGWFAKRISALPDSVRETFPFLIVPKAGRGEKESGLEGFEEKRCLGNYSDSSQFELLEKMQNSPRPTAKNHHPTVKPVKLMSYLVTLGSREGDIVLDPFAGSGTTGVACKMLKRRFIGIELEREYCDIAAARLSVEEAQADMFA